jgi:hypothetical protein
MKLTGLPGGILLGGIPGIPGGIPGWLGEGAVPEGGISTRGTVFDPEGAESGFWPLSALKVDEVGNAKNKKIVGK